MVLSTCLSTAIHACMHAYAFWPPAARGPTRTMPPLRSEHPRAPRETNTPVGPFCHLFLELSVVASPIHIHRLLFWSRRLLSLSLTPHSPTTMPPRVPTRALFNLPLANPQASGSTSSAASRTSRVSPPTSPRIAGQRALHTTSAGPSRRLSSKASSSRLERQVGTLSSELDHNLGWAASARDADSGLKRASRPKKKKVKNVTKCTNPYPCRPRRTRRAPVDSTPLLPARRRRRTRTRCLAWPRTPAPATSKRPTMVYVDVLLGPGQ